MPKRRPAVVGKHTGGRLLGSHLSPDSLASFRSKQAVKTIRTFWSRVAVSESEACWLWIGPVGIRGYGVSHAGGQTTSHRASWVLTYGPIPRGLHVLHTCDVRLCVRPDHLYLGTESDNIRDAYARGRRPRNTWTGRPPATKLTPDQVRVIRTRFGIDTDAAIARDYDVHETTIARIRKGRTWVAVSP